MSMTTWPHIYAHCLSSLQIASDLLPLSSRSQDFVLPFIAVNNASTDALLCQRFFVCLQWHGSCGTSLQCFESLINNNNNKCIAPFTCCNCTCISFIDFPQRMLNVFKNFTQHIMHLTKRLNTHSLTSIGTFIDWPLIYDKVGKCAEGHRGAHCSSSSAISPRAVAVVPPFSFPLSGPLASALNCHQLTFSPF